MVCMRIIDVVFNNYERFDMAYFSDLRDDHVNDCLRVARPRRRLSPHVNDIFCATIMSMTVCALRKRSLWRASLPCRA